MLERMKLLSSWRWFLVLAMSLFLIGAQPFSSTPSWAAEDAAEAEAAEAEAAEKEKLKKTRVKPKRLTKKERIAAKVAKAKEEAAERKKEIRDKQVARFANKLGRKKAGYFVVALQTKSFTSGKKGKMPLPKLEYEVVMAHGREAAAGKILDHMLDIKRKIPKIKLLTDGKPPEGDFKFIGRYSDVENAEETLKKTEERCAKLVRDHDKAISRGGGGGGGIGGNPL